MHLSARLLVALTLASIPAWAALADETDPPASADVAAAVPDASFRFAMAADFGETPNTERVLSAMAADNPAFALAVGDLSYDDEASETAWCDLVNSQLGDGFPFQVVAGNREDLSEVPDGGSATPRAERFAACLPDRLNSMGWYGREYYFDYPREQPLARFIMISPGLDFGDGDWAYDVGTSHYAWVANAIDDARARHVPWLIVGMHKPCLTLGTKQCESGTDLFNLLLDRRVDLVLMGHDHTYQRSKQLATDAERCPVARVPLDSGCIVGDGANGFYPRGEGSVLVTVGTGGQGLSSVKTQGAALMPFAVWMGRNSPMPTPGFLSLDVAAHEISGTFVRTSIRQRFADTFRIAS